MGGGVVLVLFGFILMWATTVVPAYAILRKPLAQLPFVLRLLVSFVLAFLFVLLAAFLAFHWRSRALLGWYLALTAVGSVFIVFVLLVRKFAGTGR